MRPTHDGPKDQRCVVQPLDDLQGRWMYTIFILIYIYVIQCTYKYTIYICYVCYVEYMDRTCNKISYQINLFLCVYEYIYVVIFRL